MDPIKCFYVLRAQSRKVSIKKIVKYGNLGPVPQWLRIK
jgi:hypothetical protein